MASEERSIPIFIDTTPNLLKHPSMGKQQKREIIRKRLESKIDDVVTRYGSLPALTVYPGEYCNLLMEARELFVQGYFYSCVAMCGITAERILKDIFTTSVLVISDGQATSPNDTAIKDLESFGAKEMCEFLIHAGVLDQKLRPAFKDLGELRNKYAHAGGKKPKQDASAAIAYLHTIVDGTVSILKDFNIREGKLVRKQRKAP